MDRCRAAGDDASAVEAELAADGAPDESVEHVELHVRHDPPAGSAGRRDGEVPIGEVSSDASLLADVLEHAVLELLPHTGHGEEQRWPARLEVLGDGGDAPGEPGLGTTDDLPEVADRALCDVTEREERQEAVVGPDLDERGQAAHRRHHVGVGDHRPFGRTGGAARVDERGQVGRGHVLDELVELTGR